MSNINDLTLLVRQPKDDTENWHIAGQAKNPILLAEEAKKMAMKENQRFIVHAGGDIGGNNVNYLLMTKEELKAGFK